MAKTPEAKVKDFVRKEMKSAFPDIWYYSPPGGAFGKAGVPDHLYLYKGVMIAIECKAGTPVTALQMKNLKHLQQQGAVSAYIDGIDKVKMQKIIAAIRQRVEKHNAH